jgi:hypothetical protein
MTKRFYNDDGPRTLCVLADLIRVLGAVIVVVIDLFRGA